MTIYIEDLKFQAIIGILDFERTTPQNIIVNLTITYTYTKEFINYAEVSATITQNLQEAKYLLLEDALTNLSKVLKEKFSSIEKLSLKITKPSILPNCRVSVAQDYDFVS